MASVTERKKQLLSVCARLFREKGFSATSMRDIAQEVGIEPASLYSHVSGKDELLQLICFGMAEKFSLAIQEVNDIYFNAEEKLKMAVENHVKLLVSNLDEAYVFLREWRSLEQPGKSEFIRLRDEYEQGIREIIQTGIDEGKFNETDKHFAALTLLSSLNWIPEWYQTGGTWSAEKVAEKLYQFVLTGLKKKDPIV